MFFRSAPRGLLAEPTTWRTEVQYVSNCVKVISHRPWIIQYTTYNVYTVLKLYTFCKALFILNILPIFLVCKPLVFPDYTRNVLSPRPGWSRWFPSRRQTSWAGWSRYCSLKRKEIGRHMKNCKENGLHVHNPTVENTCTIKCSNIKMS